MRILDLLIAVHFRRFNVPCEVQGPIMFPFDPHVICREGDVGDILIGMEAVFFIFLLWSSRDLGHEDLNIS